MPFFGRPFQSVANIFKTRKGRISFAHALAFQMAFFWSLSMKLNTVVHIYTAKTIKCCWVWTFPYFLKFIHCQLIFLLLNLHNTTLILQHCIVFSLLCVTFSPLYTHVVDNKKRNFKYATRSRNPIMIDTAVVIFLLRIQNKNI